MIAIWNAMRLTRMEQEQKETEAEGGKGSQDFTTGRMGAGVSVCAATVFV